LHGKKWGAQHPGTDRSVEGGVYGAVTSNPVCLSHREREILQWTADGKSSGEIAIILSISESTVNFHHKNIQKKFDAPNKTLAAAYAAALGLI
ncbi:LuxR C-terminal-related transcriptional regulator, partial [Pseudomonas aeruginosa]